MPVHRDSLVYPDAMRPRQLFQELCRVIRTYNFVNAVACFGSLARGEADAWSDVDLLVITGTGPGDYWRVFQGIKSAKPILHHHVCTPETPFGGGNVLGIVFKDESVFHSLDLNFLCQSDFQQTGALDRFGPLLYMDEVDLNFSALGLAEDAAGLPADFDPRQHPDDARIGMAQHWLKKAIKRYLRQQVGLDQVRAKADELASTLSEYPDDLELPTGNIWRVGLTYLKIAHLLLGEAQNHL